MRARIVAEFLPALLAECREGNRPGAAGGQHIKRDALGLRMGVTRPFLGEPVFDEIDNASLLQPVGCSLNDLSLSCSPVKRRLLRDDLFSRLRVGHVSAL